MVSNKNKEVIRLEKKYWSDKYYPSFEATN